ncbi:MAG: 50S ribosomal protein L23 [Candidatus Pacebacteria bacterium]|nr:50S ribosomal protein L23 [Candidatus Paceibacterota bacterium]
MALFGSKKNKEVVVKDTSIKKEKKVVVKKTKAVAVPVAPQAAATPVIHRSQHHDIILRPRITEKSGIMSESSGVYTFEVRENANKPMIAQAIKTLYKVTPVKVRVINLPAKRVFVRGKRGTSNAVKKAMVYLKKGEKIEIA